MSEVMTVKQIAELLNTTPQSVRNQISRGREDISVPRSFRLGNRRVWLREAAFAWLREKAGVVTPPRIKPGRPTKAEQLERRRDAGKTTENGA
jgi:hypothetical protein